MTQEIDVRVRIEPDERRPPGDGQEDGQESAPDQIERLIFDGESQTVEEAGYGHGV